MQPLTPSRIRSVSTKWLGNILWLLFKYYRLKKICLTELNGLKIKPFNWTKWHDGARCFTGKDIHNSNFFIKTDGILKLSFNEAKMSNLFYSVYPSFCPKIVYSRLTSPIKLLVFELEPWCNLEDVLIKPSKITNWDSFLTNLISLIDCLHNQKMLHRDLTPSNLLINTENNITEVKIIDFAFAIFPYETVKNDENINENKLATLGQGLNPKPLSWDDAYSAVKITERIEMIYGLTFPKQINELNTRVGRCTYSHDKQAPPKITNSKRMEP